MNKDVKVLSQLRTKFNDKFKTGKVQFRSFHDLLWQISVNGMLDDEKDPVLFHVLVTGEFGNELVIAFARGGYKRTGVYFMGGDYGKCVDIAESINEDFFLIKKEDQIVLIAKSMY